MNATRRSVLQGISSLAALSAATSIIPAFAQVGRSVGMRSAEEVIKTVCVHCVNFCAIEVHKVGGVIRSIRPDPARRDVYKADNPAKLIWQHGQGST